MQSDIHTAAQQIDLTDWREIPVDYGRYRLDVRVPPNCVILGMKEIPLISDPRAAYEESLSHPIGCPPLAEIIRNKKKPAAELTAAVTVSDITRPVPYRGENGLLRPLLNRLEAREWGDLKRVRQPRKSCGSSHLPTVAVRRMST